MKKAITTTLAVTAMIAGLGLANVASAKGHGPALPAFGDLDSDSDGIITTTELESFHSAKFAAIDTNADGLLDAGELAAAAQARAPARPAPTAEKIAMMVSKMMERGDKDGDGLLSPDEVKGPFAHMFDTVDSDGDGFVSADELSASITARAEKRGPRMDPAERAAKIIERGDKDGDGMLNMDEAKPQNGARLFARMDADKDGNISQAEWDAALAHRAQND